MLIRFAGLLAALQVACLVPAACGADTLPETTRKGVLEKADAGYRWKLVEFIERVASTPSPPGPASTSTTREYNVNGELVATLMAETDSAPGRAGGQDGCLRSEHAV